MLPTFEIAAWCVQIFTPVLLAKENTVFAVIFSDLPIHLAPFLNPLATILSIAPYRRTLFGIFKRFRGCSRSSPKSPPVQLAANIGGTRIGDGREVSLKPRPATAMKSQTQPCTHTRTRAQTMSIKTIS